MSDEQNVKPEDQNNPQPVNAANPSDELSEDELNNISGGVRKAGKEQQEYLVVKLENVQITSYQLGG